MESAENRPNENRKTGTLSFWRDLLLVVAVAVAGLYYASGFLIPLTIALLQFVLLTAVIDRIARITIAGRQTPVWLAHLLGIAIVIAGLVGILSILSSQASQVAAAIPRYEERFTNILTRIIATIGDDNADAVRNALKGLKVSQLLAGTLNSASSFLSAFFLILLYIPFMMVERGPMQKKLRLAAFDDEAGARIEKVIRNISAGLQRYIGVKTFVSVLTGLISYTIMRFIGLDFAETWGVLTFALNFIPSIGSIVAVFFPSIAALVQFDTLTPFLIIVFVCGSIQFTIGNVVEPALTGKTLNLSPMMVILALTSWTALWGLPGAFLSVPITVSMLIVLSHVEGTRWLAILMSGDGHLATDEAETEAPAAQQAQGD